MDVTTRGEHFTTELHPRRLTRTVLLKSCVKYFTLPADSFIATAQTVNRGISRTTRDRVCLAGRSAYIDRLDLDWLSERDSRTWTLRKALILFKTPMRSSEVLHKFHKHYKCVIILETNSIKFKTLFHKPNVLKNPQRLISIQYILLFFYLFIKNVHVISIFWKIWIVLKIIFRALIKHTIFYKV